MIPLLFLAIGAIALLATRGRSQALVPVAPSSGLPAIRSAGGAPSPLVVLDGFVRAGQFPPPLVIACAIAEAEAMGREDVSNILFQTFAVPLIAQARAAEIAQARPANPVIPTWSHPVDAMPPAATPIVDPSAMPMPASSYRAPLPPMGGHGHQRHHGHQGHGHRSHAAQGPPPGGDPWASWQGWGAPQGRDPGVPYPGMMPAPLDAQGMPSSALPSIGDPAYARVEILDRPDHFARPPAATLPSSHPGDMNQGSPNQGSPNQGTITVSGMNSPIAGISNEAWTGFAQRVAREQPSFTSARHVGQYRQRRERMVELGFDPEAIGGSPDLQRAALAADMSDAYRHVNDSGLIAEYNGMTIDIPGAPSGEPVPIEVTLSGIMGVVQAAGLQGAVGWLADPTDRRRFPHTTAAFLRTNGVF